jgi:hypothetical protein
MSTQTSALSQTTTRSSFQSVDPVPTYTSNGFILSTEKKQAQLESKEEKKGKDYEAALAELSGTIGCEFQFPSIRVQTSELTVLI